MKNEVWGVKHGDLVHEVVVVEGDPSDLGFMVAECQDDSDAHFISNSVTMFNTLCKIRDVLFMPNTPDKALLVLINRAVVEALLAADPKKEFHQ